MANLRSVGKTTAPPTNSVLLTGANGITAAVEDAASIATYGYWPLTRAFPSISVQPTLDDRAYSLLRPQPIRTVSMILETNRAAPVR